MLEDDRGIIEALPDIGYLARVPFRFVDSMRYYITGKPSTYALAKLYRKTLFRYFSHGLAIGQPERDTRIVCRKANVVGAWVVAIGRSCSGTWQA